MFSFLMYNFTSVTVIVNVGKCTFEVLSNQNDLQSLRIQCKLTETNKKIDFFYFTRHSNPYSNQV